MLLRDVSNAIHVFPNTKDYTLCGAYTFLCEGICILIPMCAYICGWNSRINGTPVHTEAARKAAKEFHFWFAQCATKGCQTGRASNWKAC